MDVPQSPLRMGYIGAQDSWDSGADPIGVLLGPSDALTWDGSAYVPKQRTVNRVLLVNQTISSVAYVDVTGLLATINRAPSHFVFEYWIRYRSSGAGEGIGLQLAYSGTFATCDYSIDMFTDPSTRAPLIVANTFASGIAPQAAGPGAVDVIANIRGSFKADTVGVLSCQARAETGGANNVQIMVSSWGRVFEQ
jgi:hypothetical protein